MVDKKDILDANNSYEFNTDTISFATVEVKGQKKHYVTGYISTPDIDLYNDLITEKGLKSMLRQIEAGNITLDYEHEAWRDDNTILPVGRITEAKIDSKGLWVKAEVNKHSPKFKSLWGSIKDGFINAFSIAFKATQTVTKVIGDAEVRMIEDLELLNVAMTGTPVNNAATMTGFSFKSAMTKALNDMDTIEGGEDKETIVISKSDFNNLTEEKMTDKIEKKDEAQPEVQPEVKEEVKEEVTEESKEEESKEEPKEEVKEEEVKEEVEEKSTEALLSELKSLREEFKTIKENLVFKSKVEEPEEKDVKEEVKEEARDILSSL